MFYYEIFLQGSGRIFEKIGKSENGKILVKTRFLSKRGPLGDKKSKKWKLVNFNCIGISIAENFPENDVLKKTNFRNWKVKNTPRRLGEEILENFEKV